MLPPVMEDFPFLHAALNRQHSLLHMTEGRIHLTDPIAFDEWCFSKLVKV